MTTPSSEQPQYTVTQKSWPKGQAPTIVNIPVPPEQSWLYLLLDNQNKLLDKINSRLGFIVLIIIVGILAAVFLK